MKKILVSTISIFFISVLLTIGQVSNSLAYSVGTTPQSSPVTNYLDLNIFKNDLFKNILNNVGIGTTLPNAGLLNTKNLSTGDLTGALKAIATLAINLFLIVIQTVTGLLKSLLPFLSR